MHLRNRDLIFTNYNYMKRQPLQVCEQKQDYNSLAHNFVQNYGSRDCEFITKWDCL